MHCCASDARNGVRWERVSPYRAMPAWRPALRGDAGLEAGAPGARLSWGGGYPGTQYQVSFASSSRYAGSALSTPKGRFSLYTT